MEPIPKKPGKSLVRFYENAEAFEETGWTWDEYHLELDQYGGLEDDVTSNYSALLAQAKEIEYNANALLYLADSDAKNRADIEYLGMMLEVPLV